jgi:uncharacterized tellurite resistance protein B-like protein
MTEQINIFINLAATDASITDYEAKIIKIIAKVNGVSPETFETLLKHPQPIGNLSVFTEMEKFEVLLLMVQLMKSDGQVFKSEIEFCERIAEKLGYRREVIRELSSNIYSDPTITSDRNLLFNKAHKFLKH